jgi:hypothetical protein
VHENFIEESLLLSNHRLRYVDFGSEIGLAFRKKCVPEQLKKPSPKSKTSQNGVIIYAQILLKFYGWEACGRLKEWVSRTEDSSSDHL